ncbi:MAG: NAD(P)H-dependent glycerol-3-phosphate dehydrogenase [Deltaproteobacteria bacterium]|nr:NAD(P)H-dependent glycerol-3-phosphate dehydrogenase [Deltaproteobacteria bacterium]
MPKGVSKDKGTKISVIGGGAWGTALAQHLARNGHFVHLWVMEEEVVQSVNRRHTNDLYLPGIRLHKKVVASRSLEECCAGSQLLVFATPAQHLRSVLQKIRPLLKPKMILVSVSKGIETKSGKLLAEIYEDLLPRALYRRLAFLSGPSFAREVALGQPTAVTVAALSPQVGRTVQHFFGAPFFRVYTSDDIIGVELGGAIKNVIAIAAGIVDGLGFGYSSRAGMMTRALHEMTRLGIRMGASPLTFMGLSGLGDMILTCTGDLSRNRTVGLELGKGKKLGAILKSMKAVSEGVPTAVAVHKLSRRYKVEMPICEQVYQILYKGKSPRRALQELTARPLKRETEGI